MLAGTTAQTLFAPMEAIVLFACFQEGAEMGQA
jgi:hypothetical protein